MSQPQAPEPVALVDLDGTLADFDGAMRAGMESMASPEELAHGHAYYEEQTNEPPHITARRRLIKRQPGFWENLPKFQLGMDVFKVLLELDYDITILSKAPRTNFPAWEEKARWCHKNLPMDERDIKLALVENKSRHYGRVLVDDWIAYVEPWLDVRPRGLVVMPAHPRNAGWKHPRGVRYDGTNLGEVRERLAEQIRVIP